MAIDKIGSKALVDCSVAAVDIAPGTITSAKLASTLDISSKTVTLPNTSVTNAQLAGSIANAKLANSTITVNGTAINLGASASIAALAWQSVVVSDGSTVTTMVAGRGYFINNTSAAGIVKLPAGGTAGDTIAIKDYAGNFATNNLTIQRNGHNIQGAANDGSIKTNRASVQLVYIDATKGWLYTNESNVADLQTVKYVTATGGTIITSGNFKVHTFTGDGNFVVSCGGNSVGNNKVDYLVVAGGGSAGGAGNPSTYASGGGGAGGYRESYTPAVSGPYTASPLKASCGALTVTAQTYPVTVGGGGAAATQPGKNGGKGSNSVFSTITSAGGGGGLQDDGHIPLGIPSATAANGGSGGGSGASPVNFRSSGNTPPVSPPQGNQGGYGSGQSDTSGGGGGGAGGSADHSGPNNPGTKGGNAGNGVGTAIHPNSPSPVGTPGPNGALRYFAGGGGGGYGYNSNPAGGGGGGDAGYGGGGAGKNTGNTGNNATANTGGGGGGVMGSHGPANASGGVGGKGIVIIRYKFQ